MGSMVRQLMLQTTFQGFKNLYIGSYHMLHCTSMNAFHAYAGDSVYGEKRISVEGEKEGEKIEYRVWNPFRLALLARTSICTLSNGSSHLMMYYGA